MSETIVGREMGFSGRLLKLEVLEIEMENGHRAKREVVHHPGAVAVVPVRRATEPGGVTWEALLVRQYRVAAGAVMLELVAGTAEPGEAPQRTAERELAEEIGHRAATWQQLGSFFASPGYTDERITIFLALDITPTDEGTPDADEAIEMAVVPLSAAGVMAMAQDGTLRDMKTVAGLLWAVQVLGG